MVGELMSPTQELHALRQPPLSRWRGKQYHLIIRFLNTEAIFLIPRSNYFTSAAVGAIKITGRGNWGRFESIVIYVVGPNYRPSCSLLLQRRPVASHLHNQSNK